MFNISGSGAYSSNAFWFEIKGHFILEWECFELLQRRDYWLQRKSLPDLGTLDASKNHYVSIFWITNFTFENSSFCWRENFVNNFVKNSVGAFWTSPAPRLLTPEKIPPGFEPFRYIKKSLRFDFSDYELHFCEFEFLLAWKLVKIRENLWKFREKWKIQSIQAKTHWFKTWHALQIVSGGSFSSKPVRLNIISRL